MLYLSLEVIIKMVIINLVDRRCADQVRILDGLNFGYISWVYRSSNPLNKCNWSRHSLCSGNKNI